MPNFVRWMAVCAAVGLSLVLVLVGPRPPAGLAAQPKATSETSEPAPLLTPAERLALITERPTQIAPLAELLPVLAQEASDAELTALEKLDRDLVEAEAAQGGPALGTELGAPILLTLAASREPKSLAYVHEVFETYPERREQAAVAVARFSQWRLRDEDWRILVRSLNVVEGSAGREVLRALARYPQRALKPEWLRRVLLVGLELGDDGGDDAAALLRHWAEVEPDRDSASWQEALAAWQVWFRGQYPDLPDPELPAAPPGARWPYDELRSYVYGEGSHGDRQRGAAVFEKALCHKCHRYGERGEAQGPDLSLIGGRMQMKELLRAVLFPSDLVPDQFASYTLVLRDGRTVTGLVGPAGGDAVSVLQINGEKVLVRRREIEDSAPNKVSAMPQGTLDNLSQQEIADLLAYLRNPPE